MGVTYKTAWNWYIAGNISGAYQLPTGTIIIIKTKVEEALKEEE